MSIPDSTPTPRRVGRAMAWGVAIGVGAVVLRELVRPREQPARLIDWARVEEIGPGSAASGSRVYPGLAAVGRRQWVRFNIRIFRQMFEPFVFMDTLTT